MSLGAVVNNMFSRVIAETSRRARQYVIFETRLSQQYEPPIKLSRFIIFKHTPVNYFFFLLNLTLKEGKRLRKESIKENCWLDEEWKFYTNLYQMWNFHIPIFFSVCIHIFYGWESLGNFCRFLFALTFDILTYFDMLNYSKPFVLRKKNSFQTVFSRVLAV